MWKIVTEKKTEYLADSPEIQCALDALRVVLPDFRWTMGIKSRTKDCMVYSGLNGWAEVYEVHEEEETE